MSEFASMLASFKKNAASSSNQQQQQRTSSTTPHSHSSQQQKQQTLRKRPHHSTTSTTSLLSTPCFPSMHSNIRQNNNKDGGNGEKEQGFELSFLIIGAQKAGTSWLHTLLQKLNSIALPHSQKEVHFWDWHHRKGFDWYINQFNFPQKKKKKKNLSDDNDDAAKTSNCSPLYYYGEITPDYIVLPSTTIAEIHHCFPNLKVIFVARDLVDRVWSAMIMELRDTSMGRYAGEFEMGVIPPGSGGGDRRKRVKTSSSHNDTTTATTNLSVAQQRRLEQQSSPSAQPDSYYLDRLRSETHTLRSDYATHLKKWYTHFGSRNVLLIDFRDIESKPRDVLLQIVMHIGVEESNAKAYVGQLKDDDVQQRVNAATGSSGGMQNGPASSSQHSLSERPLLRKQMEQYLRPHAKTFNALLKEEGYTWQLNEYTTNTMPSAYM